MSRQNGRSEDGRKDGAPSLDIKSFSTREYVCELLLVAIFFFRSIAVSSRISVFDSIYAFISFVVRDCMGAVMS